MRLGISRLIGDEVDLYEQIYKNQLLAIRAGTTMPAWALEDEEPEESFYHLLLNMGKVSNFIITHETFTNRRFFVEKYLVDKKCPSRVPFHLFFNEVIRIEYIDTTQATMIFEGTILSGFVKTALKFTQALREDKKQGEIKLTLLQSSPNRQEYEDSFFNNPRSEFDENSCKQRLLEYLIDPEYELAGNRLLLFYPELSAETIKSMDRVEIEKYVAGINFKSLGLKTTDSYHFFLDVFSNYYVSNEELLDKCLRIDIYLTKNLIK